MVGSFLKWMGQLFRGEAQPYFMDEKGWYVVNAPTDGASPAHGHIQTAINAAGQKGGVVYLPEGIYLIEEEILIGAGQMITLP